MKNYRNDRSGNMQGNRVEKYWRGKTIRPSQFNNLRNPNNIRGINVDWRDELEKFSFEYTEFGNWMSNSDRMDRVQSLAEELKNMAKIVGFTNLGLNGSIGLAFGARGYGGHVAAHYEPWDNIINLTKNHRGAFVHEWAHAVDYIIGGFVNQSEGNFALTKGGDSDLRKCISQIIKIRHEYPFPVRNIEYYGQPTEIWARTVEDWYSHKTKETEDTILVKKYKTYENFDVVYLNDEARKRIFPLVDKAFKLIAMEVNGKNKSGAATGKKAAGKSDAKSNSKSGQLTLFNRKK